MAENKTIYFIDDDHDDLLLFAEIASDLGHTPHIFGSGRQMLTFIRHQEVLPEAIFLDLHMPLEDGYEILSTIRRNSGFDKVPVIIHSGACDEKCVNRCFELGADYYIKKPATFRELFLTLSHALEKDWNSHEVTRENFLYQQI